MVIFTNKLDKELQIEESQNHEMVWVERNLKDHLVPTL